MHRGPSGTATWVVIDPMRAFTDVRGTLALAFGAEELPPIVATVQALSEHVSHRDPNDEWVWVRSIYEPEQFSGDGSRPALGALCTGENPVDLEWEPALAPIGNAKIVTKRVMDATNSPEFCDVVTGAASRRADAVVLTGFLLTSCVRDTAVSVAGLVGGSETRVVVMLDLAAGRASSYQADAFGMSPVDRTLATLHAAGVEVCGIPG